MPCFQPPFCLQGCDDDDDVAAAIQQCQSNGVKVILSLGGAVGTYSLSSQQEAEIIGQNLWAAYGNTHGGDIPRPFGTSHRAISPPLSVSTRAIPPLAES